jgi:hypothetical protein
MTFKIVFSVFLIALMVSGVTLGLFGAVKAESFVPKPSLPEFTLQLDNNGLSVTVQNQPLIQNGHDKALIACDVRFKWHESTNWYPNESNATEGNYIKQTGEVSTTTHWYNSVNTFYQLLGETSSHQLDYQVRAISGYLNSSIMYSSPIGGVDPNSQPVAIVSASDWTNTKTVTLPAGSPSNSPTLSPANTQPASTTPSESNQNPSAVQVDWLEIAGFIALGVVVALLVVVVAFLSRKIRVLERKLT